MPAALTFPGVYIEEIPSGVRTITGVATSITAFIGSAPRGPVNEPFTINSFADYEQYRTLFGVDPEFIAADEIRNTSGCVVRYERTFMRPLLA